MPKEFYTERDIEDLVRRGILSLRVDENVVLTELAYEKANRLGMRLERSQADNPPSAPVRPYLSQPQPQAAPPLPPAVPSPAAPVVPDLKTRIQSAVQARLGDQVDPNLLEVIIQRVLKSTGSK